MQELDFNKLDLQSDLTKDQLAAYLEQLASYDFERFIFLLYRLDIEEANVRALISEDLNVYPTLAEWILERLRTRRENKDLFTYPDRVDDEDRW